MKQDFWKKMPNRTYIVQEEKAQTGHKTRKDKLTHLWCRNKSIHLKLKPLLLYHYWIPHVFKEQDVNKARLPVTWRANGKTWSQAIAHWMAARGVLATIKKLTAWQPTTRNVALSDGQSSNVSAIVDDIETECDFMKVKFLALNMIPLLQSMNQKGTVHKGTLH